MKIKQAISLIGIFILLITQITTLTDLTPSENWDNSQNRVIDSQSKVTALVDEDPIYIDGNFTAAASFYGWNGNGNDDDPFIIDSLRFDPISNPDIITIKNTNDYFVISNCEFTGVSYSGTQKAIYLDTVQNGVIELNTIHWNNYGIYVSSCSAIEIRGNTIYEQVQNGNAGVYLIGSSDVTIVNNVIRDSHYGIFSLPSCSDITIEGNNIYDHEVYGVIGQGGWITLRNNTVTGVGARGMTLSGDYDLIENNTIANSRDGIHISGAHGIVRNNTFKDNNGDGIYGRGLYLNGASNTTVHDNIFSGNINHGIHAYESDNNSIMDNILFSNSQEAIFVHLSDFVNCYRNNLYDNNGEAITYDKSHNGSTYDNNVTGGSYGVYLIFASSIDVFNNSIKETSTGISLSSGDNNTVRKNNITQCSSGIKLNYAGDSNVSENIIADCSQYGLYISGSGFNMTSNQISGSNYGMYFKWGTGNTVQDNVLQKNRWYGMYFEESPDNDIDNNELFDAGLGYKESVDINNYHQTSITGNTLNGKVIVQWEYQNSVDVPVDAGQVILINCTLVNAVDQAMVNGSIHLYYCKNITVTGNDMMDVYGNAIIVLYSHNCTISENTVTDGYGGGIYLSNSHDNEISLNNMTKLEGSGTLGNGIRLDAAHYNNMLFNRIDDMGQYGLGIENGNNNTFANNTVINSYNTAVRIYQTTGNVISNNTLIDNDNGGIVLLSTADAVIKNNYIENTASAIFLASSPNNTLIANVMVAGGVYLDGSTLDHFKQNEILDNIVNGQNLVYWKEVVGATVPANTGQVILVDCQAITVENLNCSFVPYGILVAFSEDLIIRNNLLSNVTHTAIHIRDTNFNVIDSNIVRNSFYGVRCITAQYTVVFNNTIEYCSQSGLELLGADHSIIELNRVHHHGATGVSLSNSHNVTFLDVTSSDNYQGISLMNSYDLQVDSCQFHDNRYDGIYLYYADTTTVNDCLITSNSLNGIYLYFSDDFVLNNSEIYLNDQNGVHNYYSNDGWITNNWIHENNESGFYSRYSNFLRVETNNLTGNAQHGVMVEYASAVAIDNNLIEEHAKNGINFYQVTSSNITRNAIESNQFGVVLNSSNNNYNAENKYLENVNHAFYLTGSTGNQIMENDFVNNNLAGTSQGYSFDQSFFTLNYWNEWVSLSTDTDANGILDTPYKVDGPGNNYDYFPLANSWHSASTPAPPVITQVYPGTGYVYLTWTAPTFDGRDPITNYHVYRGASHDSMSLVGTTTGLAYNDTAVLENTTYYYAISAENGIGESSLSSRVIITTTVNTPVITVPDAPINVNTATLTGTIILTWDAPVNDGGSSVTQYLIYRGTTLTEFFLLGTTTGTSFNDITALPNQDYYYVITAINAIGQSEYSDIVNGSYTDTPITTTTTTTNISASTSTEEPRTGSLSLLGVILGLGALPVITRKRRRKK